jgi:N-acetylneuraminic acid mutarotase
LLLSLVEKLAWDKVIGTGNIPVPRVSATIAAVDNKVYLFGGLSNSVGWLNDFYVFNTGNSLR